MSQAAQFAATFGGGSGPAPVGPWLTGEALLRVRGNMCNLNDGMGSGDKSVIYTAVMPTVFVRDRPRFDLWCEILREAGSTHVLLNLPGPGEGWSYGNVWWQVDAINNMPVYHEMCVALLNAGLAPMIWLDYGGADPLPRINQTWPIFADGTRDLHPYMIGIMACEPVVGDWSSYEVSEGLKLQHRLMPNLPMGYHGSPERLVGSSNPVQADDPWQGAEAEFYNSHGGEHIDIAFYQTPHGMGPNSIYQPCPYHSKDDLENYRCTCWVSRFWEYMIRMRTGYHGWRILPLVLQETVAYEYIRYQTNSESARNVATLGKQIADLYAVEIGNGNGIPW